MVKLQGNESHQNTLPNPTDIPKNAHGDLPEFLSSLLPWSSLGSDKLQRCPDSIPDLQPTIHLCGDGRGRRRSEGKKYVVEAFEGGDVNGTQSRCRRWMGGGCREWWEGESRGLNEGEEGHCKACIGIGTGVGRRGFGCVGHVHFGILDNLILNIWTSSALLLVPLLRNEQTFVIILFLPFHKRLGVRERRTDTSENLQCKLGCPKLGFQKFKTAFNFGFMIRLRCRLKRQFLELRFRSLGRARVRIEQTKG